jgi:hypothetical protein
MQEAIFSKSVQAGGKTYFFDVKQAKAGKQSKYVQVTESRLQEGKRVRSSITIFPEHLSAFAQTFEEAKEQVGE